MQQQLLHTIPEACQLLSIGRTKLYSEINAGRLVLIKVGDKSLVPRSALDAYVEARIAEARPAA